MKSKRDNNEGSVYIRKDGKYGASVTIQGKRVQKTFKTQKQAKDWRRDMLHQIDDGLTYQGANYSLGMYLQEWLYGKRSTIKPHTYEQYDQVHLRMVLRDRVRYLLEQDGLSGPGR